MPGAAATAAPVSRKRCARVRTLYALLPRHLIWRRKF